jgi:hypothetical protein
MTTPSTDQQPRFAANTEGVGVNQNATQTGPPPGEGTDPGATQQTQVAAHAGASGAQPGDGDAGMHQTGVPDSPVRTTNADGSTDVVDKAAGMTTHIDVDGTNTTRIGNTQVIVQKPGGTETTYDTDPSGHLQKMTVKNSEHDNTTSVTDFTKSTVTTTVTNRDGTTSTSSAQGMTVHMPTWHGFDGTPGDVNRTYTVNADGKLEHSTQVITTPSPGTSVESFIQTNANHQAHTVSMTKTDAHGVTTTTQFNGQSQVLEQHRTDAQGNTTHLVAGGRAVGDGTGIDLAGLNGTKSELAGGATAAAHGTGATHDPGGQGVGMQGGAGKDLTGGLDHHDGGQGTGGTVGVGAGGAAGGGVTAGGAGGGVAGGGQHGVQGVGVQHGVQGGAGKDLTGGLDHHDGGQGAGGTVGVGATAGGAGGGVAGGGQHGVQGVGVQGGAGKDLTGGLDHHDGGQGAGGTVGVGAGAAHGGALGEGVTTRGAGAAGGGLQGGGATHGQSGFVGGDHCGGREVHGGVFGVTTHGGTSGFVGGERGGAGSVGGGGIHGGDQGAGVSKHVHPLEDGHGGGLVGGRSGDLGHGLGHETQTTHSEDETSDDSTSSTHDAYGDTTTHSTHHSLVTRDESITFDHHSG